MSNVNGLRYVEPNQGKLLRVGPYGFAFKAGQSSGSGYTIAEVAVPRRAEMMDRVIAVVPFADTEAFRIVEIGCGDGRLAAKLWNRSELGGISDQ